MRYENGKLILDDAEIQFLSMIEMKKVVGEYRASEFIGALAEMKEEAEKYIQETEAKQDADINDQSRIEVVRMVIEMFDILAEKGREAVEEAGDSIRWQ